MASEIFEALYESMTPDSMACNVFGNRVANAPANAICLPAMFSVTASPSANFAGTPLVLSSISFNRAINRSCAASNRHFCS